MYCAGDVGGYGLLWIEEYSVRDYKPAVSVGVLSWYISVGCVIVMEVGSMYLGLGCMYSIFP